MIVKFPDIKGQALRDYHRVCLRRKIGYGSFFL